MSGLGGTVRRSLTQQALHTFGTQALSVGSQIAAGILVARAFGPAGKGIISFAALLVTFAVTAADGIRNAVAYQAGRLRLPLPAVWGAALTLLAATAAAGVAVLLIASRSAPAGTAYLFAAAAFPFAMYLQVSNVLYQLRERVVRLNVKNLLTIGAGYSVATIVGIAFFHASVTVVLGLWVASLVAAAVWSSFGLGELIGGRPLFGDAGLIRAQAVFGAKTSLSATITFLALRIDVFIVSVALAPAALGVYTLAIATGELMLMASRSLLWSTSGRVATADADEASALAARIVRTTLALMLAAALFVFVAGPWAIAAVYGSRFAEAGTILRILLPGIVAYGADGMLSYYLSVRAGRPGLLLALESGALVLCTTATLAGVRLAGLEGAAAADTLTYVASFGVKLALFARLSGRSWREIVLAVPADVPAGLLARFPRPLRVPR